MSYFSSKSTWLCLVEDATAYAASHEDAPFAGEGFPPLPAPGGYVSKDAVSAAADASDGPEDIEQLATLKDLRHRLVFNYQQWEFAPRLLEDNLKLARAQTTGENALIYYAQARYIAQVLAEEKNLPGFLTTWLEIDLVMAEVSLLLRDHESCRVSARDGLQAIKKNKFPSALDPYITKMAIRFFRLLEKEDV